MVSGTIFEPRTIFDCGACFNHLSGSGMKRLLPRIALLLPLFALAGVPFEATLGRKTRVRVDFLGQAGSAVISI